MTDQPFNTLCSDCGQAANFLTCLKKYGEKPRKPAFEISTWHQDTCDLCGETKPCTEARDFFYPDEQAMVYIGKYLEKK